MLFSDRKKPLARGAMVLCAWAVAAGLASAQAPSFEDLARRAEAVLDSRPAEAASLYRQALAIRPEWAEGWFYLGAALYQTGRYAEASDAFRKGLELAPRVGTGWAFLGLCEAELDNPDQALSDIRKGLELGLGDNWQFQVAVRVKAAQIYIRSANFDEALAQLHPLALHKESSRGVVDTMGLCALGVPGTLSELSPRRRAVVALAGKAAWALADQRPAEAAAAYKELLEEYPNEPGVHYAYGLYLMETDLAGALAQFEKEVRNEPKHWPALIKLGSLYVQRGAPEQAIQVLRQALKIVPAQHRWLCHAELGQAHMTSDNLDAAIVQFETAVRLMPSNPPMHYLLSQAYRRAGRKEAAEREAAEFRRLKVQEDPLGVPGLLPGGKR
ncbi:MAG: tetratricopeptide repeat protein [Bryobacteraceae bacterium]|jgi:tetratricopeptide (TPR) repeat protein